MKYLTLILILISLEARPQNGMYQIERIDNRSAEGKVLLTPSRIVVNDSIVYPVEEVVRQGHRVHYFLKGCVEGVGYRGAATLYGVTNQELTPSRNRKNLILLIEIRTSQTYLSTRYQVYYDY